MGSVLDGAAEAGTEAARRTVALTRRGWRGLLAKIKRIDLLNIDFTTVKARTRPAVLSASGLFWGCLVVLTR